MSNAKVRARRRRRANRAWTGAMTPVELTLTDRYFIQANFASLEKGMLETLLRERFPGALWVHDTVRYVSAGFTSWCADADMPNWDDRSEHLKDDLAP